MGDPGHLRPLRAELHRSVPLPRRRPNALVGFTLLAVLADFLVLTGCVLLAIQARAQLPFFKETGDVEKLLVPLAALLVLLWMGMLWYRGSYKLRQIGTGPQEFRRVAAASLQTAAAMGISAYLLQYPLSRGFFFLLFVLGTPVLLGERLLMRQLLRQLRRHGRFRREVIIAGDEEHMTDVFAVLTRESWLGYDVVGLLPSQPLDSPVLADVPVIGRPIDCVAALRATGASAVIFAEGSFGRAADFSALARRLEPERADLIVVPALSDISAQRMSVRPLAGLPLVHIGKPQAERASSAWMKRVFDVVVAGLCLLLLSPVMLATALAIRFDDGGPVLFRQKRVGLRGKSFDCLKFRSMTVGSDTMKYDLLADRNESDGVLFKIRRDPRTTRVGRFIRRYSIDELPQLANVLAGEMSLVGPRPALEREVAKYEEHVLRRLDVRPGLTGLWQVSGRSDLTWDDAVRLDLYYVDNWSFLSDLSILARTVRAVLAGSGAY